MTNALVIAACALLGLLIGSFLNVVIWRVPRGESVISPPSACPECGHHIRARDNVPVLSWLILRGRCRDCGHPISPRYPVVELATAVTFAVLAWRFGPAWELPAYLYFGAVAVALTMIDLDVHRLPNLIVLPSYAVAGLLFLLPAIFNQNWDAFVQAWLGAVVLFAFYFVLALIYPAGMGFGDVKLAGVLGLYLGWLGWGPLLIGAFLGFVLGGFVGGALMMARKAKMKTAIPFGPFMFAGAAIGILWGQELADLYSSAVLG